MKQEQRSHKEYALTAIDEFEEEFMRDLDPELIAKVLRSMLDDGWMKEQAVDAWNVQQPFFFPSHLMNEEMFQHVVECIAVYLRYEIRAYIDRWGNR